MRPSRAAAATKLCSTTVPRPPRKKVAIRTSLKIAKTSFFEEAIDFLHAPIWDY